MKKNGILKTLILCLVAAALAVSTLAFAACNKPGDNTDDVKEVILSVKESAATIGVGSTYEIKATAENTEEKIVFASESEQIASVTEEGVVTGLTAGETTITVSVADKTQTVAITVADYLVDEKAKTVDIYCKEGLIAFADRIGSRSVKMYNYTVNVLSDVDLGGAEWTPMYGYALVGATFDGNGHKISNFSVTEEINCATRMDGASISCIGFVGGTIGMTFKNVSFENVTVETSAEGYCGIVVGYMEGAGTFDNVTVRNGKIFAVNSRRGGAPLCGYAHGAQVDGKAFLDVHGCTIENVEVISKRATGLVARVEENAVVGSSGSSFMSVTIENNTVKNCVFRCVDAFSSNETATLHWATTLPSRSIGSIVDEKNTFSDNRYFFDKIEYFYGNGAFTKAE